MEKRVVKYIFIVLIALFGIVSCDSNSKGVDDIPIHPLLQETYNQQQNINNNISRNLVLKNADNKSRTLIKRYLQELDASVIYLSSNPKDKTILNRATDLIKLIRFQRLPLRDQNQLYPFLDLAQRQIAQLAVVSNVRLDKNNSIIFNYDFYEGIRPFYTESKGKEWSQQVGNAVNQQTFATTSSIGGRQNKSWLISPGFDFSNLGNVSAKFRHTMRLGRGDGYFNKYLLKKEGFKLLYSTDYNFETKNQLCFHSNTTDGNCEPSDKLATWIEVSLDPDVHFPSGSNFHTLTTPPINLDNLVGNKRVHIAFLYNQDIEAQKFIGSHFIGWNIYDFTLEGSGYLPTPLLPPLPPAPIEQPIPLFKYAFDDSNLKPLTQWNSLNDDSIQWRQGNFRGDGFAKMTTKEGNTASYNSFLIYPSIELNTDKKNIYLHIAHTLKPNFETYNLWDRVKVFVSDSYVEGADPSQSNWQPLDIENKELRNNNFNSLKIENIGLSQYKGKNVALAFQFIAEPGDNHLWQISDIEITDEKRIVE